MPRCLARGYEAEHLASRLQVFRLGYVVFSGSGGFTSAAIGVDYVYSLTRLSDLNRAPFAWVDL